MDFPTLQSRPGESRFPPPGRRAFLRAAGLVALGGFAGCRTATQAKAVPSGGWPDVPPPPVEPAVAATAEVASPLGPVLPRAAWTREGPDFAAMDRMVPIHHVTIHHDGLDALIETDDLAASAARIELYRRGHRGWGWADIGYHFVIDRGGRVWEGRSLQWQGAHVKARNEHNIGVMCLGNFEEQSPSAAQVTALDRHLRSLMLKYRIPATRVKTHQEWSGASTLCPGRNLQVHVDRVRPDGFC